MNDVSLDFWADKRNSKPWSFAHTEFVSKVRHKSYKALCHGHRPNAWLDMFQRFLEHQRGFEWWIHHSEWLA